MGQMNGTGSVLLALGTVIVVAQDLHWPTHCMIRTILVRTILKFDGTLNYFVERGKSPSKMQLSFDGFVGVSTASVERRGRIGGAGSTP